MNIEREMVIDAFRLLLRVTANSVVRTNPRTCFDEKASQIIKNQIRIILDYSQGVVLRDEDFQEIFKGMIS